MLWWISGLIGFCLIMQFIAITGTWGNFKDLPYYLNGADGKDIEYYRVRMKFEKWKRLFELNPSRFIFILKNGRKIDPGPMKGNFKEAHPTWYKSDGIQFYVIDFDFINWIQYLWYCKSMLYKMCDPREHEMTEAIIGDLQTKINAIVEESNRHIQQTLDLQQEILDRMKEENDGTSATLS